MAFKNLTDLARDTLKPDEIREMIQELQSLLTSRNADAEDDAREKADALKCERIEAGPRGMDSRRRALDKEYLERFPNAGRLKA